MRAISAHLSAQKMTTVLECLDAGTRYLEKRGVEDARRNMQMLVAHHLQCSRMQLYLRFDEPLMEAVLVPLRADLKKRGERIPLQHLLGTISFHQHEFKTDARALIPRPETEELVEMILKEFAVSPPARVLDLACGSGVIGLSLAAAWPSAEVVLADISVDALALARENALLLGLPEVQFTETDLFSQITGYFDLIVTNLPYVAESERAQMSPEVLHDPALALFAGPEGMDLIERFCAAAPAFLRSEGSVAMEIGYDQAAKTSALLESAGFTAIRTEKDISGIERFPLAKIRHSPNADGK